MRIAVVGLGGVGGYLSACFSKAGLDVTGFGRGEHLDVIKQKGITIVEDETTWNEALRVLESQEAKGHFDVVLFCVKSYDLEDAYKEIAHCIDEKSILLSFSNGVNNSDILRKLSNAIVLDGAIYILAHIKEAGVIRKKGKVFAAVFGGDDTQSVEKVAALFEDAKLRYKTPEDIKTALWKKYIFISAFATLTSYYDISIGAVYKDHFQEARQLLEEIAQAAKFYGVDLQEEVQKSLDTASKVPYDSSTSMHKDFINHKKVELEALSGFVANTQGVDTPLMQKYYKALQQRL